MSSTPSSDALGIVMGFSQYDTSTEDGSRFDAGLVLPDQYATSCMGIQHEAITPKLGVLYKEP